MALIDEHVNEAVLKNLDRKENFTLFGLTAPYLLLVFFLIIIPVGWLFYMSFIGRDGSFSIENYERMLKSKSYIRIFITTFKISFLTTLICALLGYPLTYFMSQLSRKWAGICMIGVLIPFWTSLLVRTYAWLVLLQRKGLINNIAIDLEFISSLESVNNDTLVSALTECLSCFKTWETLFKFAGNNYETQEEASR